MKKNRIGLILILCFMPVFLNACVTDKKEDAKRDVEATTTTSKEKDLLASLGLENQNNVDTWETPLSINLLESSYMWADTLEGKILEADNIFVAVVEDMTTEHTDPLYDEKGMLISSSTSTNFKLKIMDNLRGDLPINDTIQASRAFFGFGDGKNKGNFMTLIENDIIPEKGKTYVFLTRVVDGELVILPGGDFPSNFPLENAPMDLNKQPEEVVQEVIETSSKVEEIDTQVDNEEELFDEIGDTLLNGPEIQARIEGHGNKLDMNKVIIK
ncbi:hypothetical protein [Enterococcus ureasiticus]|uniref:DUF5067 domain-containing protein n=1 Tax=Enterococcus ureasiticus TaxID=903984 RepID=A0A1E5GL48_9ENTE|nr:hypothetical protein [Enterococcus ureasiticus]OEG13434.1 hypothetical protein BCR21_00105 [Enterococcus ureasiticus]